jgi:hypothetical protein
MKTRNFLTVLAVVLIGAVWSSSASAVPAFARKEQAACNTCHNAWPMLNSVGRMYKENGYTFARAGGGKTEKLSDFLEWDKYFPATALFAVRPYDKKDSGDTKLRAIHEIELMVAGQLYKSSSGWFEFEAEDEENFATSLKFAALAYHPSAAVNVQAAWAPLTWADSYDTYSDTRRMTGPNRYQVINQAYGGADRPASDGGRLRDRRQMVSVYGRPLGPLFYNVGVSSVAGDAEGVNPATWFGRLAFDVAPGTMIGALAIDGACEATTTTPRTNCAVDRDYRRIGVDVQSDIGPARVMAVYLQAKDDNATATATVKNKAWYVQGLYVIQDGGRPTWVPLLRYDSYEQSNGVNKFNEGVLGVTYYFTHNIKGFVEYMKQLDVPTGVVEDSRFTLQLIAAF